MVAYRSIFDNLISDQSHKLWTSISPPTTLFILLITACRALFNFLLNKRFPSSSYHLSPRSCTKKAREKKRRSLLVPALAVASCGMICYWKLDTVPITNRLQLVLVPQFVEQAIGKTLFEIEKRYVENVLPAEHHMSIRARKTTKRILKAMEELKDDSSKKQHWESLNWEMIVVNNSEINAFAHPGGKIVINSGLLNAMSLDSELALLIGHEVGHIVGRHYGEGQTARASFLIFEFMINQAWTTLAGHWGITLPLSRRYELEADYMGLLLMARAGYDPSVATTVIGSLRYDYWVWSSSHPSVRTRVEALAQERVVNKAMVMLNKTNVSLSY